MDRNQKETRRAAEVMLHEADGGKVERLDLNNMQSGWLGHVVGHWDWTSFDYRIKHEPREVWIAFSADGSIFASSAHSKMPAWNTAPVKFREVTDG